MPESSDRQIRVFISSTFRDMHAERDRLVKFTFPELRKLCAARGVVWGEVDLRWGVTDEEAAEGKVLPICLEEIRRCRPYFIGLLGERYGWIPDEISEQLLQAEPWLAEQLRERKSVTELEVLHGVLRDPAMAGHAFFYFRDPVYVERLPPDAVRADYVSEDEESRIRLADLKRRIRGLGFPVHENFAGPEELGRLVLADLTAVIDRLFPEGSQPDALDVEAREHEAYAQSRAGVYVGRAEYFERLDEYASFCEPVGGGDNDNDRGNDDRDNGGDGDNDSDNGGDRDDHPQETAPVFVVVGESGGGKSALLANWTSRYRQAHDDVVVLEHYIGATPQSADWAAMLRRLMGELRRRCGIEAELPESPDALRSAFPNWLAMAGARHRVLLVLDALNQVEDREGARDLLWLPPTLPAGVRAVVSTLPGRCLDVVQGREWPALEVQPLTEQERRRVIVDYLATFGRRLGEERAGRIATAPQCANPLYLRVLLDELRLFGHHEELDRRIGSYLEAQSPYELYERVIARWEDDYEGDSDLVGDTLSLLWAARRGLSESELLLALGSDGEPLARNLFSPLFLAMGEALVSRGGLLGFVHDFLREAARDAYLPAERHQQAAHERLAELFSAMPAGTRRTDELPWQLRRAAAWERLAWLLSDPDFFAAVWRHDEYDVKAYWASIEAESAIRLVDAMREPSGRWRAETDEDHLWRLATLFQATGHLDEAMELRSLLVTRFRESGDLESLQASLGSQALILQDRGDVDGAMALHKEGERIFRQLGDVDNLQASLGNQALIFQARGDLDGAMALHKEAARIGRQFGNEDSLLVSLGNQALILKARGDWDGAMTLLKQQERICRQLGNVHSLQTSFGNQALILQDRGDLDGAMALLEEQERICRQLGNVDDLQRTLGNQALILLARGDLGGAMALLKEGERICRQLGNVDDLQRSFGNQALVLKARGDLDGAMLLLKEQERICRQLGSVDSLQVSLGNQALVLKARGQLDGAMALLEEQEHICRRLGNVNDLQRSLGNQALILQDRGDLDSAMGLHKEGERIFRQLGNLDDLQRTLGNQALILKARGDLDGAMALLEEQERICRQLGSADDLQRTRGNQALILLARGDLDGAMALFEEKERICRQLGTLNGLAISLAYQASLLLQRGLAREALGPAREAMRIVSSAGLTALTAQIGPILASVEKAAGTGRDR